MRENEAKEKEAGELKASRQKEILLMKEIFFTVLGLGAFIANPSYKIPKKQKQILLQWGQIRKKAKRGTKGVKK